MKAATLVLAALSVMFIAPLSNAEAGFLKNVVKATAVSAFAHKELLRKSMEANKKLLRKSIKTHKTLLKCIVKPGSSQLLCP